MQSTVQRGQKKPTRANSADSHCSCASSSKTSFHALVLWREDASSSAPNRTIEGRIRSWNVASSSWTSLHRLDSVVTSFHVRSNRTVIPAKWTLTNAADGSPVTPSLRGGWGHGERSRAILARGCTPSFALAASSASAAAASSSTGPAHSEDSTVVYCARREASTTGRMSR